MKKNKCLLAFGLTNEEMLALRALGKVIEVKPEMAEMKIGKIPLYNGEELTTEKVMPNEKVVLFHDFADGEVRGMTKKVRNIAEGVILAIVTPMSKQWSLHYLVNHLMQERELYRNMQKER